MIMVEPKVQIIEGDNLTRIFKAGTTCYRSEETTKKTPEEFAEMLIRRGHTAMLEHSTLAIFDAYSNADSMMNTDLDVVIRKFADVYGRPSLVTAIHKFDGRDDYGVIYVGTIRAWRELLEFCNKIAAEENSDWSYLYFTGDVLLSNVGEKMDEDGEDLTPYIYDLEADPYGIAEFARIVTVKLTTSRAVAMEAFRHRLNAADYEPVDLVPPMCISPAMESTRYVDEANGDIAFVKPWWWDNPKVKNWFERKQERIEAWEDSERHYKRDRALGGAPQASRGVLAEDVRTEIVLTATIANWKLWLKQRVSMAAHPDIRHLANLIMEMTGIHPDD